MTDNGIEQEIQAKNLTKPRVTLADIEAAISSEHYFTAMHGLLGAMDRLELHQSGCGIVGHAPLERLTFCVLVLNNGYTVTGESACVSPENFDAELGRKIARQNALDKCWPLFGFHLASTLANQANQED
jgi:hypothetical protein